MMSHSAKCNVTVRMSLMLQQMAACGSMCACDSRIEILQEEKENVQSLAVWSRDPDRFKGPWRPTSGDSKRLAHIWKISLYCEYLPELCAAL